MCEKKTLFEELKEGLEEAIEIERQKEETGVILHRVTKVKALRDYLLLIRFDNNKVKVFDCSSLIKDKLYSSLTDFEIFNTVHIDDMGLVCWNNALGINPYVLYDDAESIEVKFDD